MPCLDDREDIPARPPRTEGRELASHTQSPVGPEITGSDVRPPGGGCITKLRRKQ